MPKRKINNCKDCKWWRPETEEADRAACVAWGPQSFLMQGAPVRLQGLSAAPKIQIQTIWPIAQATHDCPKFEQMIVTEVQ